MKSRAVSGVALALSAAVLVAVPGATASAQGLPSTPHSAARTDYTANYTTKEPYSPQEALREYQRAPKGFAPIFTENVA